MGVQPAGSNLVIVAKQFNPSVLGQHWLIKNSLVGEGEFKENCLFSDALVQVSTSAFGFVLVPEQFQFFPTVETGEEQRLIRNKVGVIVERLPHTPFIAFGMNFIWHVVPPEGMSGKDLSRRLFFNERNPLCQNFGEHDALFGGYFSKDIFSTRLRLDIKPISVGDDLAENRLQFLFNYHKNLTDIESPVDVILEQISRWDEAREESHRIAYVAYHGTLP